MDYRLAEFVRFIDPSEDLAELVDEAKSETWTKAREHAALVLGDGSIAMVRDGFDGIELSVGDDGAIILNIAGKALTVRRLAWHTHPRPTGPSDFDRRLIGRLGQTSSIVYEIRGSSTGTVFTAIAPRKS